jgi:hypothetical protein
MQRFTIQELGMELSVMDNDIDEALSKLSFEEREVVNRKIVEAFAVLYCGFSNPEILPSMVDKFRAVACSELGLGSPVVSMHNPMSLN